MLIQILLAFYCAQGVLTHHQSDGDLKALEKEGVVPDVIGKTPVTYLRVSYNKKDLHIGEELTPTQVKNEPVVTWNAEKDTYYTLAVVDPDAPSRADPKFRQVNHWLVANIPNNDLKSGDVIAAYLGSGPPKNTSLHRYVFLLYKQPKKIEISEPRTGALSRDHRLNFDVSKFALKYGMGEPIAANFFKAQWDPYVDERNDKIAKAKSNEESKKSK